MADVNSQCLLLLSAMSCAALVVACASDSATSPSMSAVATISVGNETIRVALTSTEQVAAARRALTGGPRIPIGRIAPGTQVNLGWSWHLEDLTFAEATIELCDGRPSDVERAGVQFGGGHFCPWTAKVVRID